MHIHFRRRLDPGRQETGRNTFGTASNCELCPRNIKIDIDRVWRARLKGLRGGQPGRQARQGPARKQRDAKSHDQRFQRRCGCQTNTRTAKATRGLSRERDMGERRFPSRAPRRRRRLKPSAADAKLEILANDGRWPARRALRTRSRVCTQDDAIEDNIASVASCRCSKAANAAAKAFAVVATSRAKASSGSAK